MSITTMNQIGLFDKGAEAQFREFHHANPHVYTELKELCVKVRRAGVRRFGIRTVWERLRWKAQFETSRLSAEYKLNNNYTRFYARLLMDQEPELEGLFETRDRHYVTQSPQ